jgi:very-short-patch-repair endonuclease
MRDGEERSRKFAKRLRKSLTDAETIMWSYLRRDRIEGMRFRKQHPIGPFVADFACVKAMLIVEIDGATHGSDEELAYDGRRTAFFRERGWHEMRFTNHAVYRNLDGVLEEVWIVARERAAKMPKRRFV